MHRDVVAGARLTRAPSGARTNAWFFACASVFPTTTVNTTSRRSASGVAPPSVRTRAASAYDGVARPCWNLRSGSVVAIPRACARSSWCTRPTGRPEGSGARSNRDTTSARWSSNVATCASTVVSPTRRARSSAAASVSTRSDVAVPGGRESLRMCVDAAPSRTRAHPSPVRASAIFGSIPAREVSESSRSVVEPWVAAWRSIAAIPTSSIGSVRAVVAGSGEPAGTRTTAPAVSRPYTDRNARVSSGSMRCSRAMESRARPSGSRPSSQTRTRAGCEPAVVPRGRSCDSTREPTPQRSSASSVHAISMPEPRAAGRAVAACVPYSQTSSSVAGAAGLTAPRP